MFSAANPPVHEVLGCDLVERNEVRMPGKQMVINGGRLPEASAGGGDWSSHLKELVGNAHWDGPRT